MVGETSLPRRLWPLVALFAAIFVSSSTVVTPKQFVHSVVAYSPVPLTEAGFGRFWHDWWWLFVKGWHATEFGIVYLALRYALGSRRWVWALAVTAILAASDEIHQLWVPARGGHVSDWLIDLIGIGMAFAFFDLRAFSPRWSTRTRMGVRLGLAIASVFLTRALALHPF